MITGSALPRYINCTSSAVLVRNENASPWADMGHDGHEDLAHATLTGTHTPRRAALVGARARVEVKLRYNTATRESVILGEGADRNYGTPVISQETLDISIEEMLAPTRPAAAPRAVAREEPTVPLQAFRRLEQRYENLVRILYERGVLQVKDLDELV